jgi:hypothetical protein
VNGISTACPDEIRVIDSASKQSKRSNPSITSINNIEHSEQPLPGNDTDSGEKERSCIFKEVKRIQPVQITPPTLLNLSLLFVVVVWA